MVVRTAVMGFSKNFPKMQIFHFLMKNPANQFWILESARSTLLASSENDPLHPFGAFGRPFFKK